MNSGLSPGDPTLVAAFRSALLHQGAIVLLMLAFLWLLWATARTWRPAATPSAMNRAAMNRAVMSRAAMNRAMTFLDPVCTSDCPIIAQEFKQAGQMLGEQACQVEMVAVVANPTYRSTAFTRAFDRQEGLTTVPNWVYLTGSLSQLGEVWRHYGVSVQNLPAGAMSAHNDLAVIIDLAGAASSTWRPLPPGPADTQVLVPAAGGSYDALAVAGSRLTVWRLGQGVWARVQQVTVPVQPGSSG